MEEKKALILLLILTLIAGCGYSLKRPYTTRTVHLIDVQNLTTEPGLDDLFRRVFTEMALLYNVKLDREADIQLEVKISRFDLQIITLKRDLAAEYSITLMADVSVKTSSDIRNLKNVSSDYLETFVSPQSVSAIQAEKELASERAMAELCRKILLEMEFNLGIWD